MNRGLLVILSMTLAGVVGDARGEEPSNLREPMEVKRRSLNQDRLRGIEPALGQRSGEHEEPPPKRQRRHRSDRPASGGGGDLGGLNMNFDKDE